MNLLYGYNGIFGLILLFADIYAILKISQSSADTGAKALWIFAVVLLPLLGLVLWYFLGPGRARS